MNAEAAKVIEAMHKAEDYAYFDHPNEYEQMIVCLALEIRRLQIKLRERKRYLRQANKGAEHASLCCQLFAQRAATEYFKRQAGTSAGEDL